MWLLFSSVAWCHEWTLKSGDKIVDKDWYFVGSKLHLHKPNGEVIKLYTSEIHSSDRAYFIAEYRNRTSPRGPSVNKPAAGTGSGTTATPSAPLPTLFPTTPTSPAPTSTSLPGPVRTRLNLRLPTMVPSSIGALSEKQRINVNSPQGLEFSPDGKFLAIASHEGVTMVELATMKYSEANGVAKNYIYGVRFSPDGKLLLTFSNITDGVRVYGVSGAKLTRLPQSSGPTISSENLVFHPDGKRIVYAKRNDLFVFNVMTGKAENTFTDTVTGEIKAIYVNPKGNQAILAHDSVLTLIDLATGEHLERMATKGSGDRAFSETGRVIYVAQSSYGNEFRGWSTQTGADLPTIRVEKSGGQKLSLSPTGTLMFVPNRETGELWDTRTATRLAFLNLRSGSYRHCKISPDHRWAAVVMSSSVQVFDLSPLHK